MSLEAMGWAFRHQDVSGADKLVLLGIASHADAHGDNAWPSIATLMIYASVTERSVQRSLVKLEEMGLLTRVLNGGGGRDWQGDKRPNLYRLHGVTPTSPREKSVSSVMGDAGVGDGRRPRHPMGDAGVAQWVTPTSPELSLESPGTSREPARGAGGSPPRSKKGNRGGEDEWGTAIGADPDAEAERAAARERKATRWSDLVNAFDAAASAATPIGIVRQPTNGHALMKIFKNVNDQGISEMGIAEMIKEFFKKGATFYDPGKNYPAWRQFGWSVTPLGKIVQPAVDLTEEDYMSQWNKRYEIDADYSAVADWNKK